MREYSDDLKIKDALQLYFSKYHFENGGYDQKWFYIKTGPFSFPFPNTKARVDAVKMHDIHHIITEYKANLKGEVEIGAWEIASGCGSYYMAWILNYCSLIYGTIFFPLALYRAFFKGRKIYTNCYHQTKYDDQLLNTTILELKNNMQLQYKNKNNFNDYLIFIFIESSIIIPILVVIYAIFQCSFKS